MSQLQTIKSNSRPTSPVEGSIFYETDTKRILVYAQGAYHVYNRDTLSSSTGGADDLHYPNGLYTNSEATYFLNTSPEVHLDTAHFNGVDFNGPDTPAVPNYTSVLTMEVRSEYGLTGLIINMRILGIIKLWPPKKLRKGMDSVISLVLNLPITITIVMI